MDAKKKKELLKKIEEYTRKIKEDPYNDYYYYYRRGIEFSNLKKYQEAINDYSAAIESNRNNASYYYNRGIAYSNLKKYQEAINDYSAAIKLDRNNASYYYKRGIEFSNLEDYKKAIKDCSRAVKLEPSYISYAYLGKIFYNLKDYDKALKNCNKAIESDSTVSVLFVNRGKIHSKQKKYKESIKDYDEAIKLDNNEMAKELKEIISNYLDGNFKKTKESINSYRKKYEKKIKKNQGNISFEELSSIKDFLENTPKELEGYLTFADILGWKGIWKKQNSDNEKVDTLNTLLFIKHKLEEEFKDKKESCKINLISDTYVIYTKEQELSNKLSKRLIELCLVNDLLIRGATSYGKFYNNDMVYIGQTVDEAASWHEMGEEIGVFYTASAKLSKNLSDNELEKNYLINDEVNTKNGKIDTFFVNWYSEETKKTFYNIMKNEIITPDISLKYFNTEKKLNKYVKDEVDCIEEEKK